MTKMNTFKFRSWFSAGLGIKIFLVFVFYCSALVLIAQTARRLPTGTWRAALARADGNKIVFNFEVTDSGGREIIYIRNAEERLLVDDVKQAGDSIWIRLPFFESQIRAVYTSNNTIKGIWLKHLAESYQSMPFEATAGESYRFFLPQGREKIRISGRWAATFRSAKQADSTFCVGEFEQEGNIVTGTFLNATGDYRFLQGNLRGDSLFLSCFDGGHAYLFIARVKNNNTLFDGRYYSGPTYQEYWSAYRDSAAHLPDELSLTKLKAGASPILDFAFKDLEGQMISIRDDRFRNKVVLVQILGSWCPNCMDETHFLSPFYDQYRPQGLEIIGLAYERSSDFSRSQNSLRSFQKRFHVNYPILITGITNVDPQMTEKSLPQLQQIEGFPTTLFIDKKGRIRQILTGFNGPATGAHYEEEKNEFSRIVEGLLAE
jgi:thiol-disulfide isomerase/thioredoxin